MIKLKKYLVAVIILIVGVQWPVSGQSPSATAKKPLVVSLFNLGTQLPGTGVLGVFTIPVHPGLSAGTEFRYNSSTVNQFFQTAKFGIYHHQYVQTGIQLYSEAGYRRAIWRGTAAELRLGAGYLHAFTATEVFKFRDGAYDKKLNLGRPQFMASGVFGLSYQSPGQVNAPRFFIDYQFYVQMPFVKNYVPLAPNVALHAGAAIALFQ